MFRPCHLVLFVLAGGMLTTEILLWTLFQPEENYKNVNVTDIKDIREYLDLMQNTKELVTSYRSKRFSFFQNNIEDTIIEENPSPENNRGPSLKYETLRRDVRSNVREMWILLKSSISKITNILTGAPSNDIRLRLLDLLKLAQQQKQWLLSDIERLSDYDGYDAWRIREFIQLSRLVQARLNYIQNPKNCSTANKLVCKLPPENSFAEQVHSITYCLLTAYATQRTLIIDGTNWIGFLGTWEHIFLPLSSTCNAWKGETQIDWPGEAQVVHVRNVSKLLVNPLYPPLYIPKDLSLRLQRLHGDPSAWWIGQLVKYVLRPTPRTQKVIDTMKSKINNDYFVGLHFDVPKDTKANCCITEYMSHVEDYFRQLEMRKLVKRNIFLSTNDISIIQELKKTNLYNIYGSRYTYINNTKQLFSLENTIGKSIMDILVLANSHRLVCSFHSEVCRLAYEIMQTLHVDATFGIISPDSRYYFKGHQFRLQKAVIGHEPKSPDEILMVAGDVIRVTENTTNGFSTGKNLRTLQIGFVPDFKLRNLVKVQNYPLYIDI